ncbi:MAG: efflux RND transporter permease subunit [Clostridiales bacterium]|nr:efflux RND transporter permease subunit [Clostridiales bacterium]MDY4172867.1 efflux RND transporter permease subunit [Evtepia sp.]
MKIASFCIKHKVTTVLAFLLIAVFGVVFYSNLKLSLMPNMEFPAAYVLCTYPGAGPEDVEELVTRPLESCVSTLSGVDTISSNSSENVSMVMITYEDGTDVDNAAIKLREKFDALTLPDGCSDPVIYNFNVNDMMPVAIVALSGEDLSQLQRLAEDKVGPALERLEGVASADVMGGIDSQITVEVNTTALTGYGLTLTDISNYLAAANVLYPGGDVQNGTNVLTVTTDGKFQSVDDVANTVIFLPKGGSVRLSEIANVYFESSLEDSAAKIGDENCVILSVNKRSGSNEVEISQRILNTLEELKSENPSMEYLVPYEASEYILQVANNAIQNILMGVVLSAVVVFFFLRRPGATVTISLSMPFCVLTVFLLMNFSGTTLNMMSLGGVAMCIGMVVDNSIVVLENIYRYAGDGHSRYDSCVLGTSEVFNSITASSLTTIAVFLPIGLSGGMTGMMFLDFSLTVVFLILSSLLIALTLVPLMCYFLLDENAVRLQKLQGANKVTKWTHLLEKLSQKYRSLLAYFLRRRLAACVVSVVMVVVFLASCLSTNMVLLPEMDQGMVSITVDMPTGTEMEDTMSYGDRVMEIVEENCPELDNMYMTVGGGMSMGGSGGESASITANLVGRGDRSRSSKEVANDLKPLVRDIAGCEITISDSSMMASMTGGNDIQVNISGSDYDVLTQIATDLTEQIASLEDATEVTNSLENTIPAVSVSVNRSAAAQYGLTTATIGTAVRNELTGSTATTVTLDGDDLDVVVQGSGASAESLDALRSMPLATPTGGTVPLSAVANVAVELSPQTITRTDQSRQVEVTGDTISGDTNAMNQAVQAVLDGYTMPEGYRAEISSAYTEMMDNFQTLMLAMLVAVCLVYFILAAQFESFIMPVMVMLILPIALSGALFGLPLTRMDLSMVVLLALIMLVGTVVNSSIVLVDYINIRRARGQEKDEAIMEACPLRVRPIMMTTLTTVLALIPMAVGSGEGNEMLQPMGVVMISGMVIATVVTLLFTPVYYSLLDSLSERIGKPFQARRNRKTEKLLAQIAEAESATSSVGSSET